MPLAGLMSHLSWRKESRNPSMTASSSKDQWPTWARERSSSGSLDEMISQELFDHTWAASAYQIQQALNLRPGDYLLEAGSGWGRLIHALKYHEPSFKIDGYELTREFADRSRALLKQYGLEHGTNIVQGDLLRVDLGTERYDAFYSSRVIHYIEDKEAVLQKLYRSLKTGGRGLIIIPNSRCPYRWVSYRHAPLYPVRSLGKMMQQVGFQDVQYGGFGFLPARPRIPHTSFACVVDRLLAKTPLANFGGLAYVSGRR
jgi:ubiquinone/menaquinone biosynthesis C-methylase UbiE